MGFYAPAQLIRDARRHGVQVREIDINASDWDCTLEGADPQAPELRLGLRLVRGLSEAGVLRLMEARAVRAFADPQDLAVRARLNHRDLEALAAADALAGLVGNRHQAAWTLAGIETDLPLFQDVPLSEATPILRVPTEGQSIVADYRAVGLTLRRHPLALLRERLIRRQVLTAEQLKTADTDRPARVAGIVNVRQSPATAHNTTFMTLEDETGEINVIVWSSVAAQFRTAFLSAQLLEVRGEVQRQNGVIHVIADELVDRTEWLGQLQVSARNFH
jgi:error-prone DNA polymerase